MLKELFIKDNKNIKDTNVRNRYGFISGVFGIIINLILSVSKIIIGFLSNSISIMIDAFNNLTDLITSFITILGFKLSDKKPNQFHPYGYARYEYISGVLISLFMLVMGIIFTFESINKIIHPSVLEINFVTFLVLFIALILKILQMIVYMNISIYINSKTLKTNAIEARNDVITSISIFVSMIIMKIFNINIDGYLGLMVSIIILYSSISLFKEELNELVGTNPNKETIEKYKNKLLSYKNIKGIHALMIHNYGVNNNYMIVHAEMNSNLSMIKSHEIIDKIEKDFKELYNINLTIHIDPIIKNTKQINAIKKKIVNKIKKLDKEILIKDFRIIKKDIIFDCIIPYNQNYSSTEIIDYLYDDVDNKYNIILNVDKPYC